MNPGFWQIGANCFIHPSADIRSPHRIALGDQVQILMDCWLNVVEPETGSGPKIVIGSGSQIGRRATLSAVNLIHIGNNVLFGPNVVVVDCNHRYDQVGVPILAQGVDSTTNQVVIDDDAWLGANVVVSGNVHIGRGTAIGANSVVISDIPAYCVAAGNPAQVIKAWDARSDKFVKVENPETLKEILSSRDKILRPTALPTTLETVLDKYQLPLANLRSVQVEVSSACNLHCPQCFSHLESHRTAIMPYSFFQERIEPYLGQFNAIHLVGIGEPLMNPEFFKFVSAGVKAGCQVFTTSNLQRVTPGIAEQLVSSGISELSFSCDGIRPETYESIRIGGTWERFLEALDLINESKAKLGANLPRLTLNFGALRRNIEELPGVVSFAAQHGVSQIIAYHVVHYTPELADESLFHYQKLSDHYFLEAYQVAVKLGVQFFMPGLFLQPIKNRLETNQPFCIYPFQHFYIYADGRVGPCCMDFPNRINLGDLNQTSLEGLWNAEPVLSMRRAMIEHQPNETCQFCVSHGRMDITDPRFLFQFPDRDRYLEVKYGVV
ncbi:MAG: radical SAM protein [Syntrophothermus sp.]